MGRMTPWGAVRPSTERYPRIDFCCPTAERLLLPCVFRVPMRMRQTCVRTYELVVVVCVGLDTGGGLSWWLVDVEKHSPDSSSSWDWATGRSPMGARGDCVSGHTHVMWDGARSARRRGWWPRSRPSTDVRGSVAADRPGPRCPPPSRDRGCSRRDSCSPCPSASIATSRLPAKPAGAFFGFGLASGEARYRNPGTYRNHHNRLQSTHF